MQCCAGWLARSLACTYTRERNGQKGQARLTAKGETAAPKLDFEQAPEVVAITEQISEVLKKAEAAGEEGDVDESMKLMEEAEALKLKKVDVQVTHCQAHLVTPRLTLSTLRHPRRPSCSKPQTLPRLHLLLPPMQQQQLQRLVPTVLHLQLVSHQACRQCQACHLHLEPQLLQQLAEVPAAVQELLLALPTLLQSWAART